MVNVENLTKTFGAQTLFLNASFMIGSQERIGVIGPNGAGKSTFFKILMGEEHADRGEIRTPKIFKKALLRQEWLPKDTDTILQATLRGNEDWYDAKEKMEHLVPGTKEYLEAENLFYVLGGYQVEPRAKELLAGLGFSQETFQTPCQLLSGGWRMRIQLAGLLLSEPDLLLLDEPTNHLDVESVVWFEDFLKNYPKTFLIISHDRRLIEKLSTSILELTPPKITLWPVGFKKFEQDKAVRMEQLTSEMEGKEKEVEKLKDFAARFGAKASKAKQAQSKLRAAENVQEKLDELQSQMPLTAKRVTRLKIKLRNRVPKVAMEFQHATFGYEKINPLFSLEHCVVEGGKKIGIIGVNGVGKSTFLKTCAAELPLLAGSLRRNESLNIGYFSQHRMEDLPLAQKSYDYLMESNEGYSISEVRGVAASLGLSANDLDKTIRLMSGGEKARLTLSKIVLGKPDILLLDEPTNHLDIEACDAMIEGLKDFEGTVLVVSHNRDFLDSLVEFIMEVQPDAAFLHHGNYTEWLSKKTGASSAAKASSGLSEAPRASGKKTKEQKRQEAEERQRKYASQKNGGGTDLRSCETKVDSLSKEASDLDAFLMKAENMGDPTFHQKMKRRGELTTELERAEELYLRLLEEKEKAS